jgi:2-C-methyl-D-erythritol 4-phosphate cytidylyltransferase
MAKAFLELNGRPMLQHTLAPFLERPDVVALAVALPAAAAADPPAWLVEDPRVRVVAGGAERGDSVRAALQRIPASVQVVLVHDAARPLVTGDIIDRCIDAAAHGRAVIAAVPVIDTIKQVDDGGRVIATPDRRSLRAAQTPQAFPAAVLRQAYARAAAECVGATDDAALVARFGGAVTIVDGAPENLKVTTPADVVLAEALLARRAARR